LVLASLGDGARTALEELMRTGYEYQSEFARRHQAEGEARGRAEGEARALLTVLEARGKVVSDEQRARILASTDLDELEGWLRKAANVDSTGEIFD
jgi:hypothetical protein